VAWGLALGSVVAAGMGRACGVARWRWKGLVALEGGGPGTADGSSEQPTAPRRIWVQHLARVRLTRRNASAMYLATDDGHRYHPPSS
jgi:hypothetical protein